jgi:hypothetical protein
MIISTYEELRSITKGELYLGVPIFHIPVLR